MTNVLLFESDNEFAEILKNGLSAYGCETTVVEDGEEGIALASESKPDLILLTIELPRMNGFSVCNKLKRNNDLKQVPLVLLSSDATEETFEQHKRLRTRADEYVHKPVELTELVSKLQGIVSLDAPAESVAADDVLIDEPSALEEVSSFTSLDDEAEEAFGQLMAEEPAVVAEEIEMDDLVLEEDDGLQIAPAKSVPPPPPSHTSAPQAAAQNEALEQEVSELKAAVLRLEGELKSAQDAAAVEVDAKAQVTQKKDAEIELLQRELEELKTKLESNEASGSAREFLDLREQLNKRDKEIIDIRDQLTSREKELVKVNDDSISLGREKADLMDQVANLQSKSSSLQKQVDALTQDKEMATKRGDDFQAKSERLQAELDAKIEELRGTIEAHENAMATRDAHDASTREDHARALVEAAEAAQRAQEAAVAEAIRQTEERAAGEKEQALVQAAEEAAAVQAAAISAREGELRAEHDSRLAALHRANEESLRKLRAEHEHESEQAAQAAAQRLAEREQELEGEKQAALADQRAEHDSRYQALEGAKAEAEQQRDARIGQLEGELAARTQERDTHYQTIGERDSKIEQLEAQLASLRAAEVELKDQLEHQTSLLNQAREKWGADSHGLRAAQEALSAALSELENAQNRPMP